jgi:NAD(P)-dependent dehydrogenase (short-subunit alcohol dehydrogenase family)
MQYLTPKMSLSKRKTREVDDVMVTKVCSSISFVCLYSLPLVSKVAFSVIEVASDVIYSSFVVKIRMPLTKPRSKQQSKSKSKKKHVVMSLSEKNVIITGATSGFGVEMAKALCNAGARDFFGGRRADKGEQVAEEIRATFCTVDVADSQSNQTFFEAAEGHFGGPNVDFVLLNAGVEGNSVDTVVADLSIDTYDYIFSVNVRGTLLGLKYGTKILRDNGTFLVTSSAASIIPLPVNPVYASSKAALDSLVRTYAAQFADSRDERIKSLSIVATNPTVDETELSSRFVGGNMEMANGFAKIANLSQRMGKADELAAIATQFVQGDLPYQNGDLFVTDADTHFPLSEYFSRMQKASAASA